MARAKHVILALAVVFTVHFAPGCDKPKTPKSGGPGAPAATDKQAAAPQAPVPDPVEEALIGTWEAKMGKRPDVFAATTTLDVRRDKTFTMTHSMTDSTGNVTNVSEGHWSHDDEFLVLSLERSPSGREMPADQRQVKLWQASDESRVLVNILKVDLVHGPSFRRKGDAKGGK